MTNSSARNQEGDGAQKPEFSVETMELLFFLARDRVAATVVQTPPSDPAALGNAASTPVLGAFVSLKKRGRLRSCMGYLSEGVPLARALEAAAVSAAREDPRFPPIEPREFYDLDLEVWALGGLREIQEKGEARRDAIRVGRDGIQIEGRGRRGLLLPSVAIELGWDESRFLEGVCEKAGLARDAWKSAETRLFAFEGVSFKKPFVWLASKNPELARLIETQKATPNAQNETQKSAANRSTFSFAPGFFNLRAPENRGAANDSTPKIAPAPSVRSAAVAGAFYPQTKAERDAALDEFERKIERKRMAAATSDNLDEKNFFGTKKFASGALIPHAGWVYSGFIATETLKQIKFPETIVVLAPKHRAEGANLAVMPQAFWDFGGERLPNNLDFVERFCNALPEFKKDELAHRREHSIEVQLPILARLAPNSKVVGLLLGRSTATELTKLAEKFANFLTDWEKSGEEKPLLLISSDMNHYANDESTRKIDAEALAALETTDPAQLFNVVFRRGITMCGVLPAFFATSTLKKRGDFNSATKIDYATSADASGDRERVVGYAGYIFN